MIFKFPKKKIVLDCFTSEIYAAEYAPVSYAIKHMPDWWKNLPSESPGSHEVNMRNCAGMVDYYKKSVTIPLWTDLDIGVNADQSINWQFSDRITQATHHRNTQYTGFLDGFTHIKIESPWFFKSEKEIDWVWSHPVYNYSHHADTVSLPGITNFYHQHSTHINLLVRANKEKRVFIPQGQPMAILTPMSDRKVEVVRHLVSPEEISLLTKKSAAITFKAKYKKAVSRSEQFQDCPFHKKD